MTSRTQEAKPFYFNSYFSIRLWHANSHMYLREQSQFINGRK